MDTTVKLKLGFAALMIASGHRRGHVPRHQQCGGAASRKARSLKATTIPCSRWTLRKLTPPRRPRTATMNSLATPLTAMLRAKAADTGTSYVDMLDVGESLGYITIPKIDVNLPIYEGTSDDVLLKGVGHLEGSSYPLGGAGTPTVC